MPAANANEAEASRRRSRLVWFVRALGIVIAAAAIGLCARTLVHSWAEVRGALTAANPADLLAALVFSALAMLGLAVLWWRCLCLFDSPARPVDAVAWYFGGELGKYVPGGVWSVLGRGELARRGGGISRASGYATTLIGYGTMVVAAAGTCGALAPLAASGRHGLPGGWSTLVLLVPISALLVHPYVLTRTFALVRRATRRRTDFVAPRWPTMLRLLGWSVPTWVLLGGTAVAVTDALDLHQQPARVALAAIAAWIVGFLAVPVPAGVGLREILFVVLCGLPAAPATTVAVVMRVLLVLVDGVGGVAGLWHSIRTIDAARKASDEAR